MKTSVTARARSPRARRLGILAAAGIVLAACAATVRADWPDTPVEGLVSGQGDNSSSASVGMDSDGRFICAYQKFTTAFPYYRIHVLARRFAADGSPVGDAAYLNDTTGEMNYDVNFAPSLAMSVDSLVHCNWLGHRSGSTTTESLLSSNFDFDTFAPTPIRPPLPSGATADHSPSAGQAAAGADSDAVAWVSLDPEAPPGLLFALEGVAATALRECGTEGYTCFVEDAYPAQGAWQPAVCQRTDGKTALAFADAEEPNYQDSPFNIKLTLFQSNGTVIGDPDFTLVNVPSDEVEGSTQKSAAVAFDDSNNIVVVWLGPPLAGCGGSSPHVYARRFHWYGDPDEDPVALGPPVRIDNDADYTPISGSVKPAVALTQDSSRAGAFVVAWNARPVARSYPFEIHGQYVDPNGTPVGGEFRINQDTSDTGSGINQRLLANSAQHTLQYGPDNQVVAVWTAYSANSTPGDVHYTLLPPDYAESLVDTCCKGDIDGNGVRNGLDIQAFVDLLLEPQPTRCWHIIELCPADMNNDALVNIDDIPSFVQTLLIGDSCNQRGGRGLEDCNNNGIPDANDIYNATSQDCNSNFIPDECDIAAETSNDLNENGVPDECEPDCNQNGVPDDWDIAQETSADIDSNGVPDECQPDCNHNSVPDYWDVDPNDPDGNNLVSADCDGNGGPDECQRDCNQNGVPDVCDIDPNDPDGDEIVWEDCNGNGRPDVCDFNWPPPLGSLDCNENGIPDECDIANCPENDPSCQDCNENGFPDGCDIAAEISLDENENGIPDECEGEGLLGGGGMMQQESMFFGDPEARRAAWGEYFDWTRQQVWGPNSNVTGAEQFRAMTDKLRELGLPVRHPPM